MNRHDRRAQASQERRDAAAKKLGADVRYGGRTLEVKVFVNTDEDEREVALRVQAAAKGPKGCMTVLTAGILDASDAEKVWELAMGAAIDREVDRS